MIPIVTFLLMRLSRIECSLKEVGQRRYDSDNTIPEIPENIEITEDKCSFIETKNDELKERNNRIDTKARTLLTLTSLILGLASSTTGIASAKFVGILAIIPLIFLFLTILLLTVYFGIDTNSVVDYSYLQSEEPSAKKALYNDILKCQYYNELVVCFLLDLYRSALRYFIVGMLCIMSLGIWNIATANINTLDGLYKYLEVKTEQVKGALTNLPILLPLESEPQESYFDQSCYDPAKECTSSEAVN